MPPVVQHETSELPASNWCPHELPLLKLPVIARRNDLCEEGLRPAYHTTKRLSYRAKRVCRGIIAIKIIALRRFSRGAFALKSESPAKSPGFG